MSCPDSQVPYETDAELMRNAADGDVEAFGRLYRRFGPVLRHLFAASGVRPATCDDLTQKVFTSLWERRRDFRAEASFETYLLSIARHTLSKELRRSRGIVRTGLKDPPEFPGRPYKRLSEPEAKLYLKELTAAIEQAKGRLTEAQRQALDAANDIDIDPGEPSAELGCSGGTFKKRLERARKRLRELLAPFLDDEDDSEAT